DRFKTAEAAVAASVGELAQIDGIATTAAQALRCAMDEADPDAERDAMLQCDARMVLHCDDDYPPLLAAIEGAPSALWIRGEFKPEDQLSVAIVGSRRCTAYGREQA